MDDLSTRPLVPSDVPGWAALLRDAEAVDATGRHVSAADLAEELGHDDLETFAVLDGDRLLAVGTVLPRGETEGELAVEVAATVAPAHRGRGIGTALTRRLVDRSLQLAAERRPDLPARVNGAARAGDTAQEGVLTAVGMRPGRSTLLMRTSLAHPAPVPPLPAGYRVRGYDAPLDEPLRQAHNLAFGGHHPGFTPWAADVWREWVTGSRSFRGDVSFVALAGERIAGYVVTHEHDGHTAATGRREAHVARVGTLPEHRGRGLAGALLGHTLHACAAAGYHEASLHVDAENPTGALGVYRRAGFEPAATWTSYALRVASTTTSAR